MIKINFRGKEISKLEANIIKFNLKLGLMDADLNEEEKKSYIVWKNGIDCLRSLVKEPSKKLSERDYLISELNSEIKLVNLVEKIEYCKDYGHLPNNERVCSGQGGTNVYGECKRCGAGYSRPLSSKEWKEFNDRMDTPFMR